MSLSLMQRRIITSFTRRNMRGWGRPLAFWRDRLRLGAYFAAAAVVFLVINIILNHGIADVLAGKGGVTIFLNLAFLFTFCYFLASLFTYLVPVLRATHEPPQKVTGTVQSATCNAEEIVPFVRDTYHFITMKLTNGTLRAFAIEPTLHDQVCHVGQKVSLSVTPGIEHVDVAK